jgi:D-sedoheptulose 7-phosphate isomerase
MKDIDYIERYFDDAISIINALDVNQIEKMIEIFKKIRDMQGRLFILGIGGGAGNAAHAVNDFRKICGIEAYSPTDNVSELTARINDDGWELFFLKWLETSHLNQKDGILVFSVGGGNLQKNISVNLIRGLEYAREKNVKIMGIVGRDGGFTAKVADACIIVPQVNNKTITPHTESIQCLIWHLLVSSPELQKYEMKWETLR